MITLLLCLAVLGGWCVMWWFFLTPSARIRRRRRTAVTVTRSLRNRFTFAVGVCGWIFAGLVVICLGGATDAIPLPSVAIMAAVSSLFAYACAMVTMFSVVRLTPHHLVVRNPGRVHHIPWSAVRQVRWQDGLDVVVDGREEPLHSTAFQGSLAGQIASNPSARNAAEEVDAYRTANAVSIPQTETRVTFPLRAHLTLLAGIVLVYWLALPATAMLLSAIPTSP